jgi:membrane protease YdiL (CAAX protease family)
MLNRKKIAVFIGITYGFSWMVWLPNVLAHNFNTGWSHSDWLHLLGGLGPVIGAMLTTFLFDKKQGLQLYFKNRLALPEPKWLLLGLGMPILFFLIPVLFIGISTGQLPDISQLGHNSKIPVTNTLLV